MIIAAVDQRESARDALALGRWLATIRSQTLLPAWVHPQEQLPRLLDDSPEAVAMRATIEALAADVRATLPPELRPEMRLVSARSPAQGLQRLAERERASMIVLGASERTGIGRVVPGSTARRLLSGSPTPVAVAPRGLAAAPDPASKPVIGVGFDGSPEGGQAVAWAAALAAEAGGRLRLLAVDEPIPVGGTNAAFPSAEIGRALRLRLREEAAVALAGVPEGLEVETVMLGGDPALELARAGADLDLLVLGSRRYGPLRSVLLGSVSEATIAEATTPVVLVPRQQQ